LPDVEALCKQCLVPLKIFSTQDPSIFAILIPTDYTEYSGVTKTTYLNNLANILIGHSISLLSDDEFCDPKRVALAAEEAGYIVTILPIPFFQRTQFLKNSPVFDSDGKIRAILNFGVFLRASGTCRGDLPGSGDLAVRAARFQNSLAASCYPRARPPILTMYYDLSVPPLDIPDLQYKVAPGGTSFSITDENFLARYALDDEDLSVLHHAFSDGYMTHVNHKVIDSVIGLDYSMNRCDSSEYINSGFPISSLSFT
jgi:hypothetical protein